MLNSTVIVNYHRTPNENKASFISSKKYFTLFKGRTPENGSHLVREFMGNNIPQLNEPCLMVPGVFFQSGYFYYHEVPKSVKHE